MTIYATRRDAIEREILPALGEYADAHDIDAIVDACFECGPGGYVQTVDTEQFWQYVEAAAIGPEPENRNGSRSDCEPTTGRASRPVSE